VFESNTPTREIIYRKSLHHSSF